MNDHLAEKNGISSSLPPPEVPDIALVVDDDQQKNRAWLASILLQRGQKVWQRFMALYQILRALPRQTKRLLNKKLAMTTAQIALMVALTGAPIYANNIAVTTTMHGVNPGDDECSLSEAIITANDTADGMPFGTDCAPGDPSGPDTIQLSGNTYNIDYAFDYSYGPTGLPTVTSDITIEGNGATIQGQQPAPRGDGVGGTPFRLMAVADGNLTIDNATLTGGSATDDPFTSGGAIYGYNAGITITNTAVISGNVASGHGGGIALYNNALPANIQLNNSTMSNNQSLNGDGGAIDSYGNLVPSTIGITGSTISGNSALGSDGGGVSGFTYYAPSTVNITDSTISGNSADDTGGAVYNYSYYDDATVTVNDSTISGNDANNSGGGIYNYGYYTSTEVVNGSTISGNFAGSAGGGVYNSGYAAGSIVNGSTISGNVAVSAGGGIYNASYLSSTVAIENNAQILNNTSYYSFGGGIANMAYLAANVTVQGTSVISGNQSGFGPDLPRFTPEGFLPIPAKGGGIANISFAGFAPFDSGLTTPAQARQNDRALGKRETTAQAVPNGIPPVPPDAIVTIENSIVTGNRVNGAGGGVSNQSSYFSAIYVGNDSAVTNNDAVLESMPAGPGGASYANGGGLNNVTQICRICPPLPPLSPTPPLRLFYDQEAPAGFPLFGSLSGVLIENSVVSGNTSDGNGGGIYNYAYGRAYVDLINNAAVSENQANGVVLPRPESGIPWKQQRETQSELILGPGVGLPPLGFGGGVLNISNYGGGPRPASPEEVEGLFPPGYSQLLVNDSTISGNTSTFLGGGAGNISYGVAYSNIRNNAHFTGNESTNAYGGGLSTVGFYIGVSSIEESTISGNQANSGSSGGVGNTSPFGNAYLYINKSTIANNSAYVGGGFYNNHPGPGMAIIDTIVNNSTISGNSATYGGGIVNYNGNITLNHTTITNNNASYGGGIYSYDSGTINLNNSIVAANPTGNDCDVGSMISGGFNLDSDGTCIDDGVNNDITAADPLLGPLQVNAPGNTATHALLNGSPAFDAIPTVDAACGLLPDDQRGVVRPQEAGCDIGAVEQQIFKSFLPVMLNNPMPDLVITNLNVAEGNLSITIENQGTSIVTNDFWVDLYLNPSPPPTAVNEVWDLLGTYGAAWGVTQNLAPGESLVLTLNDSYFDPVESNLPTTIPAGTVVYAQVDAAHIDTTYGAVLENHEFAGDAYNNISGPETTTSPIVSSLLNFVSEVKSWLGKS